tara:strand:- start:191 stop:355 length:165 start_codon:yes stop_codon:yes gene_type:complete
MRKVINFSTAISVADERRRHNNMVLLTTIRDNVETLLNMMTGIRRNPEAVAWRL